MQLKDLHELFPDVWNTDECNFKDILSQSAFKTLGEYLKTLEKRHILAPDYKNIFKAFELINPDDVNVVILGQDPYPTKGDACGLSFSVQPDQKIPRSLQNIFLEIKNSLDITNTNGDLSHWSKEGVMLLNTTLTTEINKPGNHKSTCWSYFTDQVISFLNNKSLTEEKPIVFLLWGNHAKEKKHLLTSPYIHTIETSHPSPFSARYGFLGSDCFKQTNDMLEQWQIKPPTWST